MGGFRNRSLFTICHSANDVTYTVEGFIENKDKLELALEELMQQPFAMVADMFADKSEQKRLGAARPLQRPRGQDGGANIHFLAGANVMLSLRFSENITALMRTMEATAP